MDYEKKYKEALELMKDCILDADGLFGLEEKDYMYSMDKSDMLAMVSHFANWQKEKMMAKAVDVEVKVDAGGYPYIPQMELYDYDNDVPLAKAGDRYKVILIKEE